MVIIIKKSEIEDAKWSNFVYFVYDAKLSIHKNSNYFSYFTYYFFIRMVLFPDDLLCNESAKMGIISCTVIVNILCVIHTLLFND